MIVCKAFCNAIPFNILLCPSYFRSIVNNINEIQTLNIRMNICEVRFHNEPDTYIEKKDILFTILYLQKYQAHSK